MEPSSVQATAPAGGRVFDLRALVVGAVLGGGVAIFLTRRFLSSDQNLGPTAAALSDGFNILFAMSIGIAVAGVAGAGLARGTARLLVGVVSALAAYLLTALVIATTIESRDISLWERVREWVLWLPAWLPLMVIAALIGWCLHAIGGLVARVALARL